MPRPDLDAFAEKWLQLCGSCDAGIGGCTHPAEDYRPVMDTLVAYARELEAENERLREAHGLINEHADGWREKYHAARAELAQARADECDAIATYLEKLADLHDGPIGEHLALNDRAHALVARERANAHRSGTGAELAQRGDVVGWVITQAEMGRERTRVASVSVSPPEERDMLIKTLHRWNEDAPGRYQLAEVRALAGEGEK